MATADVQLEQVETDALAKQYACALEGLAATWAALQLVEAKLREDAAIADVVPIGTAALRRGQKELRAVVAKALDLAKALDVPQETLGRLMGGTVSGDVGAIAKDTELGRMAADIHFGGAAPAASFMSAGRDLAGRAVAKLGSRRAVAAAASFGRFGRSRVAAALGHVRRGLASFAAKGGPFASAAARALTFFAAAAALRFALTGGAPLLSNPWAVGLMALGLVLILKRR